MGRVRNAVTGIIARASQKDISLVVRLTAIGFFLVLLAVAYSVIYRGTVKIDVSAKAAAKK